MAAQTGAETPHSLLCQISIKTMGKSGGTLADGGYQPPPPREEAAGFFGEQPTQTRVCPR